MTAAHALAGLLLLGACTTANIDLADGTTVHFTRFATDVGFELRDPAGNVVTYSSNPSDVAQQRITDSLVKALALASGRPPIQWMLPNPTRACSAEVGPAEAGW
jgi:hypothetical protein